MPDPTVFAARPGAVGVPPQHFGNPVAEQRALAEGRAVVDLSDRGVVTVTGPDRLTWLDSLLSQRLHDLAPGQSAEALLLSPQGRIEHTLALLDDGETTWILAPADRAADLASWLDWMRFMRQVEVADVSADLAVVGVAGEQPIPSAERNGVPLVWRDTWGAVAPGGHRYGVEPTEPWAWREAIIERDRLGEFDEWPAAGSHAVDALRIAAGRPAAADLDERAIPHELDWLSTAVHLAKGCYRGQETVAKVHNLGHPPRRLVVLHLDGSENVLPEPGDPVRTAGDDGKEAGHVTSVARHHELGPIALALVRRSTPEAAVLVVDHEGVAVSASQQVLVPGDAGATADVPRLPRLGAVKRVPRDPSA